MSTLLCSCFVTIQALDSSGIYEKTLEVEPVMGENIQRLKSCITDFRNKIEFAEERSRRAEKVLKVKEQRRDILLEDMALIHQKVTLKKDKLKKTHVLLEGKHHRLEKLDEVLREKTEICKELTRNDTQNFQKTLELEIAMNKARAKAMDYENKTIELKTRAKLCEREIQMAKIAEMKAKRKTADLTSRLITRKGLLERLKIKEEQFHKREEIFVYNIHNLEENIQEATTRAEAAERRITLLKTKVSQLRQELLQQRSRRKRIFRLKNELEHLPLDY